MELPLPDFREGQFDLFMTKLFLLNFRLSFTGVQLDLCIFYSYLHRLYLDGIWPFLRIQSLRTSRPCICFFGNKLIVDWIVDALLSSANLQSFKSICFNLWQSLFAINEFQLLISRLVFALVLVVFFLLSLRLYTVLFR